MPALGRAHSSRRRAGVARPPRNYASPAEIKEFIWVAAEMRAGGAFAHSTVALDTIAEVSGHDSHQARV
jgi:hypothetical protein